MDFSKFSDQEFNPKDWINQAFKLPDAQQNRDVRTPFQNESNQLETWRFQQYANGLVMKLQLFIQEVSKSLEETSGQIVQTMPRVLREVESMQQEAILLQNRMKAVQQDVQKVETETATAMDSLLKIDTVKGRMHGVEKALREIDNWTSLTTDIEDVFSSGDADLMARRLEAMQLSLKVIGEKVPDFKDRHDYLNRLKDQFIALISPSVVAAFTSKNNESVKYFHEIFENLDRLKDLEQYYQKCLKSELNKSWNELLNAHPQDSALVSVLSAFYDVVLTTYFNQMKWCGEAFKQPAGMICEALTVSLGQLDPTISTVLHDRIDGTEEKLGTLVNIKNGLSSFLDSMTSSLKNAGVKDELKELSQKLAAAAYAPLVAFAVNYQQYQQSILLERLNLWNFEESDFQRSVTRFGESLAPIFNEASGSLDVCVSLTEGLGLPFLLKALSTYFANYLALVKKLVDGGASSGSSPRRERSFNTLQQAQQVAAEKRGQSPEENWQRLETLVTLMRTLGSFFLDLTKLEDSLAIIYGKMMGLADASGLTGKTTLAEDHGEGVGEVSVFASLLLEENRVKFGIEQLIFKVGEDSTAKLLPDVEKQAGKIHQRVIKYLMEQIFCPLDTLFDTVPKLQTWSSNTVGEAMAGSSLPSFGLAPQEYITKVGQYMMTLAHHLEPFLSAEDASFCASLRKGTLPHLRRERKPQSSEEAVQMLLDCAGQGVMLRYSETASRIRQLSSSGAQQLSTDIDYLSNVMEDLGLVPSETMLALKELLKIDPKKLKTVSESYPAPLVSAVREMRKIDS